MTGKSGFLKETGCCIYEVKKIDLKCQNDKGQGGREEDTRFKYRRYKWVMPVFQVDACCGCGGELR